MSTNVKAPRNLWPLGIIVVCATFVAGTAGLIVVACSQKVDLVSADYYEKELKYQGQIDRAERTQHDARQAAVAYDVAHQNITVSLPPGQAHGNVSGNVELYRPSAAGLDRAVRLDLDASGVQRLDASALAPGLWKVRVSWTFEQRNYYLEQKVVVGAKTS
jgi:hypothetical protein